MPESRSRRKPAYTPPPVKSADSTPSPSWFAPTMVTLLVAGLLWIVVTYIWGGRFPVPGIGNWNLAIGFAVMLGGFGMLTRWH